jgi:hypothetical protein
MGKRPKGNEGNELGKGKGEEATVGERSPLQACRAEYYQMSLVL